MSYDYKSQREVLFTDAGQRMFLRVRDRCLQLLKVAGAFRMNEAIQTAGSGDSWTMLACVDRMAELGEIVECQHPNIDAGQNRIFTDLGWRG